MMIDELEALEKAASEAPWLQGHHVDEPRALCASARRFDSLLAVDADGMAIVSRERDAALIAAARNALPALIAVVKAAERCAREPRSFCDPTEPARCGGRCANCALRDALAALR